MAAVFAVVLAVGVVAPAVSPTSAGARDTATSAQVTTYAGDNLRTGWYPDQPGLSPEAVSSSDFGQLFSAKVTGQVYAQPLVSNGTLLVETENNDIYGLDPVTGDQRWTRHVHIPWNPADVSCGDLIPTVGITGTPVVDAASNTEYFFAKTYDAGVSGPGAYYAHAVDVTTGNERAGFPVKITGNATNVPGLAFDPTYELQRPALLLLNGVVYAAFGGHCDRQPYEGWIVGVTTSGSITTMWSDVQRSEGAAGIWQSGGGLVSDGPDTIMFASGNGDHASAPMTGKNPPASSSFGESVVRLKVQSDNSLAATDFFTPYDAQGLDNFDLDFGSGGPVELPPATFGTPAHPHLTIETGKEGYVYLLDADNLGGYQQGLGGGDAVLQRAGPRGGVWSRPSVWPGDGGWVYLPTASGNGSAAAGWLDAYRYGVDGNGNPSLAYSASASDAFGFSSGSPVVTSSGTTSGSAIVWTVWSPVPSGAGAQLRAYDAIPINGTMHLRWSAPIGTGPKFAPPGIADGRVYVGTRDGAVLGFGRPTTTPLRASATSFPDTIVGTTSRATATFTANRDVTVTALSASPSPTFNVRVTAPALPLHLNTGDTLSVPLRFKPSAPGVVAGTVAVTTDQGEVDAGLSGRGLAAGPLLNVTPSGVSFGGVAIGTTNTAGVTLTNDGSQPLTVNSVTKPSQPFTLQGAPATGSILGAGKSVTVQVTFAPTQVGNYTSSFTVHSTGGHQTVALTGSAGTPARLSVSRTSVPFPSTAVGATADRSFVVTNTGGTALEITKSKPPIVDGFVAVTPLAEGTVIQPGEQVPLTVRFSPPSPGTHTASWTLNGGGDSSLTTVTFSGDATPVPGAVPPPTSGQWTTNGSTTMDGATLVLTPAAPSFTASSFWPGVVDPRVLHAEFDVTMDGGANGGGEGATFAIIPAADGAGAVGDGSHGLGWGGLGGVAVTFDTVQNGDDPSGNFVGIATGTNGGALTYAATSTDVPTFQGHTRHVAIDMSKMTGKLAVSIDGTRVAAAQVTLPQQALVGFTAATSDRTNRHAIDNVSLQTTAPPPAGESPVGSLDVVELAPGGFRAAGWGIDPDTPTPIDVHVYVDGVGARAMTANVDRPDIGTAFPDYGSLHGFDGVVATTNGVHTVCAYAIDAGGVGPNPQIGCKTIDVSGRPFGSVDVLLRVPQGIAVRGWTIDPDTSDSTRVHMYLDGIGYDVGLAGGLRPDVGAAFPLYGSAHGYDVFLPVDAGQHTLCVYAINLAGAGGNTTLRCSSFVIDPNPFGALEHVIRSGDNIRVVGWGIDPDTGAPIHIHVYVDGIGMDIGEAALNRPDIGAIFDGYGNRHGYDVTVPVPPGPHAVCAYAIDLVAPGDNQVVGCTYA